jgi:hypothetical protein
LPDGDLVCHGCGAVLIAEYSNLLRTCGLVPYFTQITMSCLKCSVQNIAAVKSDYEASRLNFGPGAALPKRGDLEPVTSSALSRSVQSTI